MSENRTKPSKPWKSTAVACEELGISRWTLVKLRKSGQLKKGYHYKVKNPQAYKLTYQWHCDRIQKTQGEYLEA